MWWTREICTQKLSKEHRKMLRSKGITTVLTTELYPALFLNTPI